MAVQSMRDWLRTLRAMHGMVQKDFAEAIGVSRSTVANYESGATIPDDVMGRIREAFPGTLPPGTSDLGPPMQIAASRAVMMPYAGEVPCSTDWGDPLESKEQIPVDSRFDGKGRYTARVRGDSCYPALQPGDLTVWQKDSSPPYGVIVIAQRRGDCGVTVKELAYDRERGRSVLRPVNPSFDAPDDGEGWDVTARLVGVIRENDGPEQTWRYDPGLRSRHLMP